MSRARIALFVLEALPNARVMRRFVAEHAAAHPGEIVLVGLSNADRPNVGGMIGQVRRHLARSGPRFLPYLAVNFGLPDILRWAAPLTQALASAGSAADATPLHTLCGRLRIPTITINDVNGTAVRDALRLAAPDLIVTYHFDQILAPETIAMARLGGLNMHPSLLPRHRGPVPTIHALSDLDRPFGITLHRTAASIDTGAVVVQAAVDLPAGVTATRAALLLHEAGRPLLDEMLDAIARSGQVPDGRIVPILSYCPFPNREMLRDMRRRGLRLTDRADLADALTLHTTSKSSSVTN